jgi:hypothetical protein
MAAGRQFYGLLDLADSSILSEYLRFRNQRDPKRATEFLAFGFLTGTLPCRNFFPNLFFFLCFHRSPYLEAQEGIEPSIRSFADFRLATWRLSLNLVTPERIELS